MCGSASRAIMIVFRALFVAIVYLRAVDKFKPPKRLDRYGKFVATRNSQGLAPHQAVFPLLVATPPWWRAPAAALRLAPVAEGAMNKSDRGGGAFSSRRISKSERSGSARRFSKRRTSRNDEVDEEERDEDAHEEGETERRVPRALVDGRREELLVEELARAEDEDEDEPHDEIEG